MNLIKKTAPPPEFSLLSCDWSRGNKFACLAKDKSGNKSLLIDFIQVNIPDDWLRLICEVRWLNEDSVLVWPIAASSGNSACVGRVSLERCDKIDMKAPLDIFVGGDTVFATTPEQDFNDYADLISIRSADTLSKGMVFFDHFIKSFSDLPFMEVSVAVADEDESSFWFVADNINLLWRWDIKLNNVDTWPILQASSVTALTCLGNNIRLVRQLDIEGEKTLALGDASKTRVENRHSKLSVKVSNYPLPRSTKQNYMRGYSGDRLSLWSEHDACLFILD